MAHPKHQAVRVRYEFRCGYCRTSETDTGGELTVDHFQPQVHGGDDSDDNLVYAYFRCNLYKGASVPTEAEQAQGLRLLHPLRDNLAEHIREDEATGRLEGITPVGTFHIVTLKLNRAELIAQRQRRLRTARNMARLDQAEAELLAQTEMLRQREATIRALDEQKRHKKRRKRRRYY